MFQALYTKKTISDMPTLFRIESIASDGMWYSLSKWQKLAKVTEEELEEYVATALASGRIVQSPTGTRSFRMPVDSVRAFYAENNLDIETTQLFDFAFPPRIWNGKTEPEGFLESPVREIGVVSFVVDRITAQAVEDNLRGVAKVREVEPGKYKAYGLNSAYIKERVIEAVEENCGMSAPNTKVYSRKISKRREMSDFDPAFSRELVNFYKEFGKSLVKQSAKTISIFIPSPEEQDAQVLMWILEAIEKFDESASVPFPGYLDTVLRRWPYNLPGQFLGKELSQFQKDRARAIESLKNLHGGDIVFSHQAIATEMGVTYTHFIDLEEKHKAWIGTKNAEPLIREDRNEEKTGSNTESMTMQASTASSSSAMSNRITIAAVRAAMNTGQFDDCIALSGQIDSGEIVPETISSLSNVFVEDFSQQLTDILPALRASR